MEITTAIGLGLALAVDASVAAFSCGLSSREHRLSCPFKLAAVTGALQGLMPLAGFFAAERFVRHISAWAHWIAFGVFVALGVMFIHNALTEPEKTSCGGCMRCAISSWKGIFALGVATSIDALAVGAGLACAGAPADAGTPNLAETIFVPAGIIAGTTFACVLAAFFATGLFRRLPVKILGCAAGLILIALGVNALL